ncbi:uncharacterized protein LOC144119976 [Amblyomma americanum]
MCDYPSSPDRPTAQLHTTGSGLHLAIEGDHGQGADCCRERSRDIATCVTRSAGKLPVAEVAKRYVASDRRLTLTIGEQGADDYHHNNDYHKGRLGSEKRMCGNASYRAQLSAVPPATRTWSKTSTWASRIAACAVQTPQAKAQAAMGRHDIPDAVARRASAPASRCRKWHACALRLASLLARKFVDIQSMFDVSS